MSPGETTSEEAQAAGPNPEAEGLPPGERSAETDVEVHPMTRQAIEKHRRDLPELMKRHAYQWAAYRGEERLEIGHSMWKLYYKYLDRGLSRDELVVLGIGPEIPDVIDEEDLLDV